MQNYFNIFITFLKFGLLAWGGPVAQINMIREKLVEQENWIDAARFNRVLSLYQVLPGPEAHEMCVYMGMVKAGRLGGFLAGLGFMLPGFILMLLLAWAYTLLGPSILIQLFIGVQPAVAALITRASHKISQQILINKYLILIALFSLFLCYMGINFLFVLIVSGLSYVLMEKGKLLYAIFLILLTSLASIANFIDFSVLDFGSMSKFKSSSGLFIEGLKAGLLSFGGAYTALPFLKEGMVGSYPAITEQSFLDGIALTSVIPSPLIMFGTFLGYLASGLNGAIIITVAIFLPAFAFTLIGHNYFEKIIEYKPLHSFLDGISAGVSGILILTALQLVIPVVEKGIGYILFFCLSLLALYFWKSRFSIPVIIIISGISGYILL